MKESIHIHHTISAVSPTGRLGGLGGLGTGMLRIQGFRSGGQFWV